MTTLMISSVGYETLAAQLAGPQVFWLADSFNQQWVTAAVGESAMALEFAPTGVGKLIAVGGCSVRDQSALLAQKWGVPWNFIPSILSTDCIGVNRAIEYQNGQSRSVMVARPQVVHLNYALLRSGGGRWLNWWCAAGIGDLLACISASIHQKPTASTSEILAAVPAAAEALQWLATATPKWNDGELERLARLLLASSEEVTQVGSTIFSAAGEHQLYYALRKQGNLDPIKQPHGLVVAIGTLMSAWAYGNQTQQTELEEMLRTAYQAVGLPTTLEALCQHGIQRRHVLESLAAMPPESFLAHSFKIYGQRLFDGCF